MQPRWERTAISKEKDCQMDTSLEVGVLTTSKDNFPGRNEKRSYFSIQGKPTAQI